MIATDCEDRNRRFKEMALWFGEILLGGKVDRITTREEDDREDWND